MNKGRPSKLNLGSTQDPTYHRRYLELKRREALQGYGGKCYACGETDPVVLDFDHVNGDGSIHRILIGTGTRLFRWLKAENYPASIQVLCANCHRRKTRADLDRLLIERDIME